VPFVLIYTGKYRTEDKLKIETIRKLNTTPKSKQHKTQLNKTTLVYLPFTTLSKEMRWLILQRSLVHTGQQWTSH